jgi:hypothetical protein
VDLRHSRTSQPPMVRWPRSFQARAARVDVRESAGTDGGSCWVGARHGCASMPNRCGSSPSTHPPTPAGATAWPTRSSSRRSRLRRRHRAPRRRVGEGEPLRLRPPLPRAGLAAVCFDQRGPGESEGALDDRAIDDIAVSARSFPPAPPSACAGSPWAAGWRFAGAERVGAAASSAICPATSPACCAACASGASASAPPPRRPVARPRRARPGGRRRRSRRSPAPPARRGRRDRPGRGLPAPARGSRRRAA